MSRRWTYAIIIGAPLAFTQAVCFARTGDPVRMAGALIGGVVFWGAVWYVLLGMGFRVLTYLGVEVKHKEKKRDPMALRYEVVDVGTEQIISSWDHLADADREASQMYGESGQGCYVRFVRGGVVLHQLAPKGQGEVKE